MTLTKEQQKLVEDNLGLVGKVIKDKVHGLDTMYFYTYDDLFQIGCIGLSKAAMKDKGGCFSTFAYRLIWNEICDALAYATKRATTTDLTGSHILSCNTTEIENTDVNSALYSVINKSKALVNKSTARGIDALLLMNEGYSAKEIAAHTGQSPNLVTATVSKARKFLRTVPELKQLYNEFA